MNWNNFDRILALWVCTIVTCALVFVCVGLSGLIFENSSTIASWVQAIGSIFTLLAGFVILNRQIRSQAEHVEEGRLERVRLIANALFQSRRTATSFLEFLPYWEEDERDAEDVFWWLETMSSIPALEYPGHSALNAISLVLSEGRVFQKKYSDYVESGEQREVLISVKKLIHRIEEAEVILEKHLNDCGKFSPTQMFEIGDDAYYPAGRENPGPDLYKSPVTVSLKKEIPRGGE